VVVAFVVSLAIAHTILDVIRSILTGATDDESFLSVLPGHEMLKDGKGKEGRQKGGGLGEEFLPALPVFPKNFSQAV